MTVKKHLKQLVRERMAKTGESYTTARRQIIKLRSAKKPTDPAARWHLPGSVPAANALRILLTAAGVNDPTTGEPFSEAMIFGIAGGIGMGVAAFRYEKEDFSSFFITGRHLWFDDEAYLKAALARVGIKPTIKETAGAKGAEKQLRDALESGPCIAWVDMANLPHRALPATFSGSAYHLLTVYAIDGDQALIGDLTDEPVSIPLADLADARGRIKKQKHRLLSIPGSAPSVDLRRMVNDGLSACQKALVAKPGKGPLAMTGLGVLRRWADRLHGSKDKESWEKMFPPGINLWRGLASIHSFIENYGNGGGLGRPIFAEFLCEAAEVISEKRFAVLAEQYAKLGRGWSALAEAALPCAVPAFREAKELYSRYAESLTSGGPVEEKRQVWARLGELAELAKERFWISESQSADLRAGLQQQVRALIAGEEAAAREVARVIDAK
jgi:hypothetical protein